MKPGAASLLAALALAGAALATVPARATGFEELGGELGDRVDRHVLWNGTFRLRGALFSNLDLDRGPTPSGQLLFPVPLSDPNAQTLTHADMRLRSDLTFVAPNGGIAVKLRLDVLDGVTLGSAPDGPPSAATGQSPGSAAIAIKRAWAETLTPFGVLAAGRMGSGWGLGILTNGGDCFDCDSGDAADRVAFATPLLGLIWAVALDFTAIGPTTERRGGTHAVDLDPADDVWTFTFALLRYHDARAHTRRKAAGKLTFDAGAYLSHRWQDKDVPAEYTPVAVDVPLTQRQVVTRGFTATAVDAWVRVTHPDFEVEAEGVVLFGGYDQATLVPGALLRDEVTASQWGFALESRFGDGARGLSGGLNVGAASGDPAYGFGVQQPLGSSAPARGDLDGPQASLPGDARFDNLRFHPDYRVDQILFREILGTITDAAYLRPHGRVVVTDFLAGELVMDLALVASMALEKTSTPGQAQALGVELDPSVSYRSEDGFRVDLDYAVLFPLAGLDNPDLGLGAKPAQLWRLRLGYLF
ncbi:MAG: TIGR04551 family protein [Myxococcales bacterium]|nr:TIGR04551 family protein [Myxococcales bacterium]MCB9734802.1 TIGR04551 family protein [Deltaproteobacteria bacterium]